MQLQATIAGVGQRQTLILKQNVLKTLALEKKWTTGEQKLCKTGIFIDTFSIKEIFAYPVQNSSPETSNLTSFNLCVGRGSENRYLFEWSHSA